MSEKVKLKLFFNFRSPYCYLASKTLFSLVDNYDVELLWRPLGGWDGRSPPDRAKVKLPLARQDVARWARRMQIAYSPPPPTTDPTPAGLGSLLAEEKGCLREYLVEVMHQEWSASQDIGQADVLIPIAQSVGLDRTEFEAALSDTGYIKTLEDNWQEAQQAGVIGVPTFVVNDQIFWGNDRIDFVSEYLQELGLAKTGGNN